MSRLESAGGVRDGRGRRSTPRPIADAHRRYAAERDAAVPDDADPRPSGGVGGTRQGVKCLHAHYAWHLAGGDDPVGRWVAERLAAMLDIDVAPDASRRSATPAGTTPIPVGPSTLLEHELADPDPPAPAELTNALGVVTDHLDDVIRDEPASTAARDVPGRRGRAVAPRRGRARAATSPTPPCRLDREAAEDVFRTLATERRADRLHNPGLEPGRVDTILGTCCVVLAVMRRLHLDRVTSRSERP